MFLLPASMKWIESKTAEKVNVFFLRLRAAYSVVCGPIWPKFELIQARMCDIVICNYEKDSIIKQPRKRGIAVPIGVTCICCQGNQSSDPIWHKT